MCCEGRGGPLSSQVFMCTEWHRLCTSPSLAWPGGVLTQHCRTHQHHSEHGGQSHCLCLSQSSLLCPKPAGGTQLLIQSRFKHPLPHLPHPLSTCPFPKLLKLAPPRNICHLFLPPKQQTPLPLLPNTQTALRPLHQHRNGFLPQHLLFPLSISCL